jgi:zinc D-Ala-D-Ala carboxypeptidase
MSTSGPMLARGTGTGAGLPRGSHTYVAGSPRRARERRRIVLVLVVSLAVLTPIGLWLHSATTSASTVTGQQANELFIDDAQPAQPPSEPGALAPALSRALGRAQTAARAAGFNLQVRSGWRSAADQQQTYNEAIAKYGSAKEARHWVLPPAESAHVKGLAVDVGPHAAAAWLEKNGVRYGLCRRYANEWWHFERLAPAVGQRCPTLEPYAGG